MPRESHAARAFTMIEMMIAVVVVAILTVIALPDEESESAHEGKLASERLDGDLAYARSCSIAFPDDPMIIKFDCQNNRYWIARKASPNTPVLHPATNEPCLVQFGPDGDADCHNVTLVGVGLDGDDELGFETTGGIDQSAPAVIQLRSGNANYELTVAPAAASSSAVAGFWTELPSTTYRPEDTVNFGGEEPVVTPPDEGSNHGLLGGLLGV